MITNPKIEAEIAQQWATTEKLVASSRNSYLLPGFGFFNQTAPEGFMNLPFVLAYAVLDQVLRQLESQGIFHSRGWELGKKMSASKKILRWCNYSLVKKGKNKKNALSHKGKPVSETECLQYIKAIQTELKKWKII